ncbi:carbon-nitrogen hydrolase family protein [Antrihabitans sp. YC3-6]|uniref:Carbon-nitrogen hydrolase family protein n=1 Tax=Antrihabitans stalagmiti TaxID=2799499 RepID=A0A934NQ99_9NOCA|nr:carbon-nitrogen hydrolase family protein [Antrihabitans stalagmiti]MBJ8339444.1 carbon-nitrogen hydrolase family protein [Antrihabitans stalagmiti]
MRITVAQIESGTDIDRNLATIERVASQAADAGSQLVVFPEYATYEKPRVDRSFVEHAQPRDGAIVGQLTRIARQSRIAVVAGIVEQSDDPDRAFNTLLAIDSDGAILDSYRKIHLFDCEGFKESTHIRTDPVPRSVTVVIDGVRFGLLTCYDLRFPELARVLTEAGAQVLLVCSSWVPGPYKIGQWLTLAAARAIENSVYVVAVNQTSPASIGHSVIVDPMGSVLEQCGESTETRTADLLPAVVAAVRARFPVHAHRRLC